MKLVELASRRKTITALLLIAVGACSLWGARRVMRSDWYTDVQTVSVRGTELAYRDLGEGTPPVIIINGVACIMDGYYELQKSLAGTTRVVSYDRPGLGRSVDTNAEPRTLDYISQDLVALVEALDIPRPYILVGHSLGGHIIRYHAAHHPDDVAGLVFLDHPHEDWFRHIRATWTEAEQEAYFRYWNPKKPGGPPNAAWQDTVAYEANCDMVRGVDIPPHIPTLMFTATNYGHFRKDEPGRSADLEAWTDLQTSLLRDVEDAEHIIDYEMDHWVHHSKPDTVTREIIEFIGHVRDLERARR